MLAIQYAWEIAATGVTLWTVVVFAGIMYERSKGDKRK